MLFQLPTGKTIYLSVDEFLNLTDSDVQYLVATNSGTSILNPFCGSAVNKNAGERYKDVSDDIEPEEIEVNDYEDELDINIDDLDPNDFPSYEGENEI